MDIYTGKSDVGITQCRLDGIKHVPRFVEQRAEEINDRNEEIWSLTRDRLFLTAILTTWTMHLT